jgi:hypothetical protein
MKDETSPPVSPEDGPPQRQADELLRTLRRVRRRLRDGGRPGLVEVDAALKAAQQLKKEMRSSQSRNVDWKQLLEAFAFVIRLAVDLYSLFSYFQPQRGLDAFWVHHKVAAGGRWNLSARSSESFTDRSHLFVAD